MCPGGRRKAAETAKKAAEPKRKTPQIGEVRRDEAPQAYVHIVGVTGSSPVATIGIRQGIAGFFLAPLGTSRRGRLAAPDHPKLEWCSVEDPLQHANQPRGVASFHRSVRVLGGRWRIPALKPKPLLNHSNRCQQKEKRIHRGFLARLHVWKGVE